MNSKSSYLDDGLRVVAHHRQLLDSVSGEIKAKDQKISKSINETEALLQSLGYDLPEAEPPLTSNSSNSGLLLTKTWDEILAEAKRCTPEHADFDTLLTQDEISNVLTKYEAIGSDLNWLSSLDRYDFAISIATGVIAGVIDLLLVGIPAHPGFLGSTKSEGGWLSKAVKEKVNGLFPPEKIKALEKAYSVSYDSSTSHGLLKHVKGLGPRSHRFQSLGHDPLLGFVFGVRDILTGEFSAISKDGHLIVQKVTGSFMDGEALVIRILEAMKTQLGHLASDVATSAGLPTPLMPLLSFLQCGKIGDHEHTIADVARAMYGKGYDFRHFLAASIPVMITEVIIRLGYFIREIRAGKSLLEAIPSASSVKIRRQLLIAHTVATLINAGKVYVTQNPLAISWPQALAFLRYVIPELSFLIYGKEATKSKMVEEEILRDYHSINSDVDRFIKQTDNFILVM